MNKIYLYTCGSVTYHRRRRTARKGVQEDTLHPEGRKGLESIQQLEESLTRVPALVQEDAAGQPPVFTSQFVNLKDLNEGEIAHFEATLTPVGDQTMQVEWFFRGKPLKAGHRIRTVHAFGMVVLEILGTVLEDSGRYTCRATNKWGKAEVTVDLECTDKTKGQRPQFTTQLQNLMDLKYDARTGEKKVETGSQVQYLAKYFDTEAEKQQRGASGIAPESVVQGREVHTTTQRQTQEQQGDLEITRKKTLTETLEQEHKGVTKEQRVQGPVQESKPPVFTKKLQPCRVDEGHGAKFQCTFTGQPAPKITWYRENFPITPSQDFQNGKVTGDVSHKIVEEDDLYTLLILEAQADSDSGSYECVASNSAGEARCQAHVVIEGAKPKTPPTSPKEAPGDQKPPTVTEPLKPLAVKQGQSAVFRCRIPAVPVPELNEVPPTVTPLADLTVPEGSPARFVTSLGGVPPPKMNQDQGSASLVMRHTYPEDEGVYVCRATNASGQAETSARLTVQLKAKK
ncbi:myosin light chain kinase, smooth muscle-like [Dermacentor albipictus]|uniref:myosin light chain kinase, smooth muscle-like n=1 Tax=Dermacentor albipictus TaxID=60249 RepID=UPI0038FC3B16